MECESNLNERESRIIAEQTRSKKLSRIGSAHCMPFVLWQFSTTYVLPNAVTANPRPSEEVEEYALSRIPPLSPRKTRELLWKSNFEEFWRSLTDRQRAINQSLGANGQNIASGVNLVLSVHKYSTESLGRIMAKDRWVQPFDCGTFSFYRAHWLVA